MESWEAIACQRTFSTKKINQYPKREPSDQDKISFSNTPALDKSNIQIKYIYEKYALQGPKSQKINQKVF